jgi:pilus biogenesis lipoprotein CpaD
MSKIKRFWRGAAFAFLCLTGGCGSVEPTITAAPLPQPRVTEIELVHTVYFDTDVAELSAEEASALHNFARLAGERLSIEQVVIGHADVRANDAYNDDLSARRATNVAASLVEGGIPSARISRHALGRLFPVAAADQQTSWQLSRRVEVLARGLIIVEPNCPDWSRPSALNPDNLTASNHGCATALNLARMVDDPRDLASGAALGPADGTREAASIRRYRADDIKALRLEALSQ